MDVRFAVPRDVCNCFAQFRKTFSRRESCLRCFGRPQLRGKLVGFLFGLAASNSFNLFDLALIKAESNFNAYLHIHWPAIFHRRLKLPLFDGLNRFCVQSETESAYNANVTRSPLVIHNEPEDARTLGLCDACLFGIFRIRRSNRLRSGDSAAHLEHASANSATTAVTNSSAMTYAYATTGTRTNSSARSSSVRRWSGGQRRR